MKMLRLTYFLLPDNGNQLCWKGSPRLLNLMIGKQPELMTDTVLYNSDTAPPRGLPSPATFPLCHCVMLCAPICLIVK
jgi:hypothetical protein